MEDFKCPPGFQEHDLCQNQDLIADLDDNQELVLIRTPWNFDIEKLNGGDIDLSGVKEFESGKNTTILVKSSRPSRELQNICTVRKDTNGNRFVPVCVNFKKQIDISESYTFEEPTVPSSVEKHVPFPTGLKERLTPYGSGEPIVFSKKRHGKKNKTKVINSSEVSECFKDEVSSTGRKRKRAAENMAIKDGFTSSSSLESKASRKASNPDPNETLPYYGSTSDLEDTVDNKRQKKKNKVDISEDQDVSETSTDQYTQHKKRHKEKKSKIKESLSTEEETFNTETNNEFKKQTFKKHKRKKEFHKQIKKEPESYGSDEY